MVKGNTVKYVTLGRDRVPALGLGTWQMGGPTCRNMVEAALAMGYRHIDTAQMYDNEQDVGAALRCSDVPRDELWVTTKLARDNLKRDDVLRSTEASLTKLGLDHVDLLLIHWPSAQVPLDETLHAMLELKDQQLTRRLGVSNFPPWLVDDALSIARVFCNQIEYHPLLSQKQQLDTARRRGMLLTAYSPLARGKVVDQPVLTRIGEDHGKSAAQVALRWLIQQENVAAVPKASSREHLEQNLDIFDFELSAVEMARIAELSRKRDRQIDPHWAPSWASA